MTGAEFFSYNEINGTGMISVHVHSFESGMAHRHDFYEIEYIAEGQTICCINGVEYPMSEGDMVFVTPSDVHQYKGDTPVRTITVHFNPESVTPSLALTGRQPAVVGCTKSVRDEFQNLLCEYAKDDDMSFLMVRNILERLLMVVFRADVGQSVEENRDELFSALAYINKNFNKRITQSDVCKVCGYSPSYFCRVFSKGMGMTFVEYLNKIRLESASRLLLSTDMTVVDICYECGFGTIRNFNREFKKLFGMSPTEYRSKYVHVINE